MKKLFIYLPLILTACTIQVTPKEFSRADEVCKNNGGVYTIAIDAGSYYAAVNCKNGARFTYASRP